MHGLDDIAVFIKVIQAGSFTRAAQLLSMPITTASAKVAALERRLGVTLIRRTTRKLSITEVGAAYFKRCQVALEEIHAAEKELSSAQAEPQGSFRITAPADIGHTLLRPILAAFLQKYPKVNVELVLTNRYVDLVQEAVDLALRVGNLKDSTLIAQKYVHAPMGLWASPEYLKKFGTPNHPRDLAKHEFVKFTVTPTLKLTTGKDSVEIVPRGRIVADDMETIKYYVADGHGLGIMPQFLCSGGSDRKTLVSVLPKWRSGEVPISFVYPPQRFVSANTHAFIEVAKQTLPEGLKI